MPTETKHERAESEQPENPVALEQDTDNGEAVPAPPAAAAHRSPAKQLPRLLWTSHRPSQMIAAAVFLILCVAIASLLVAWKLHRSAVFQPTASPPAGSPVPQPELSSNWPPAPGPVATEEELAKPWSSKRFTYRDPIIGTDVQAIVVRLPDGGYWGFSLVDPIRRCQLEYVTDLNRLQSLYHFRADHPMVGNPCNFAVFDLLQYSGPPDAEVRGAPVNGIGVRPPIAIEIEQEGKEILATKIE